MKRFMIGLIIAIPLSSVIACTCLIVFALSTDRDTVTTESTPLSKTSWREQVQ